MTRDEWLQHEKKRQSAALNKRAYCQKIGVEPHYYHYYQKKYRAKGKSHSNLAELIVKKPSSIEDFSITLELTDQGGIRFSGHAKNLILFHKKMLSLTNEKSI